MESSFSLTSSAFTDGGVIPAKYTCDGTRELSPPLSIRGVPEGTASLALVMDDPDIPSVAKETRGIQAFDHWVLYNIPADTTEIPEGARIGAAGLNTSGGTRYVGPCPPSKSEPSEHRYIFTLYALSEMLSFAESPTKRQLLESMQPMVLASAKLTGRYLRT